MVRKGVKQPQEWARTERLIRCQRKWPVVSQLDFELKIYIHFL